MKPNSVAFALLCERNTWSLGHGATGELVSQPLGYTDIGDHDSNRHIAMKITQTAPHHSLIDGLMADRIPDLVRDNAEIR